MVGGRKSEGRCFGVISLARSICVEEDRGGSVWGCSLMRNPIVGGKLWQDTSCFLQMDKAGNFTVADN